MFYESRFAQSIEPVRLRLTKLAPSGPLTMSTEPSEESSEKPKRRAGRQPKRTGKQSHIVTVRLTDEEYAKLVTDAAEYRTSLGEVLRATWLDTPEEARARKPLTAEQMADRRQLIGMAGNLNQITKQLNAGLDVREDAVQLLARLHRVLAD